MELSIVIPALNEAPNLQVLLPALHQVVDKLMNQFEVIVVDGGSTDGTADVAGKLGAKVVRQTEPGYGGALKAGFAAATGEFVATMDADFSHRPWFLRRMWNMRNRAELVIASRLAASAAIGHCRARVGEARRRGNLPAPP